MSGQANPHGGIAVPSPEGAVSNPAQSGGNDLLYALIVQLKQEQALTKQSVEFLKDRVAEHSTRIDKVDDLRVDIGRLDEAVKELKERVKDASEKLDKARLQIMMAAGVVAVFAVIGGPLFTKFFLPPSPPAAAPPAAAQPTATLQPSAKDTGRW